MSGYITFRRFITPGFIVVIYLLGAIAITILSIALMAGGGYTYTSGGTLYSLSGGAAIVVGFLILIFGNLAWRISCEYLVVQFRIYDEIVSLNRILGGQHPGTAPAPPANPGTQTCPTCGGPLRYIQQYQRWYCDKEQKYV